MSRHSGSRDRRIGVEAPHGVNFPKPQFDQSRTLLNVDHPPAPSSNASYVQF
jgi:hypothetical protein